jgi:hypothetical protein
MILAVAILALLLGGAALLAMVVISALQLWLSRRRVERLGGTLLLQVVRPRRKQLEAIGFVLYAVVLIGYFVLAVLPAAASRLDSDVAFQTWLLGGCFGLLCWSLIRWTRLEFREGGVIYGSELWTWESIRGWDWKGGGCTLRLKVPHRMMWYGIAESDKASVQAILEERHGRLENPV